MYFGRKPNTEWRIITQPESTKNLNKYSVSDPQSAVDLDKVILQVDEDSLVQESENKRAKLDKGKEKKDTSGSEDEPLKETAKRVKRRCFAKVNPHKKAGKPSVIEITNKIKKWTDHTVMLHSGKIIRKSDVYKV